MPQKTVAVLFGGQSSEHAVSCISAASVLRNIPAETYDAVKVGITEQGKWLLFQGEIDKIEKGTWQEDPSCVEAVLSPDPSHHGLLILHPDKTEICRLDAVFPVLHGKNGEDGTMQGLLELSGIPYVGCNTAASAVCMDKALTKTILEAAGIPGTRWMSVTRFQYCKNPDAYLRAALAKLAAPIFVKPANAGSSVGISRVETLEELRAAIEIALQHDYKLILEEGVEGQEIECAVMGNEEPVASSVGEIVPCNTFYDYDAKYLAGKTETFIPAHIPPETAKKIRETAIKAYQALGCTGLARVDFFVRKSDGAILLNEPNTIPGFTSISMFPQMFHYDGVSYPALIDQLLTYAVQRKETY